MAEVEYEGVAPAHSDQPQGWYPDPRNPKRLRWWNGSGWGRIKGRVNRLAVAALAFAWAVPIGGPPAIVLGVMAIQEINDFGDERGRELAMWAILVGVVNLAAVVAGIVFLVLALTHHGPSATANCPRWEAEAGFC